VERSTPLLEEHELLLVLWCGGMGLVWAMVAAFVAFSFEVVPTPGFELGMLVRVVLLWPVLATVLSHPFLAHIGLSSLPAIAALWGLMAGLAAGLVAVFCARR